MEIQIKLEKVARAKIPVSEECPAYNLFTARREVAIRLVKGNYNEDQTEYIFSMFDDLNNKIKEYFLI